MISCGTIEKGPRICETIYFRVYREEGIEEEEEESCLAGIEF